MAIYQWEYQKLCSLFEENIFQSTSPVKSENLSLYLSTMSLERASHTSLPEAKVIGAKEKKNKQKYEKRKS